MTNVRRTFALATAALVLAAMTACASNQDEPSTEPSPPASAPSLSSPTSTPTAPSDEEAASDAATELVRTFYAVRDELRQDPDTPLAKLRTVAISTELTAQQNLFERERNAGVYQAGATKIADLTVQSVSLDNADPKAGDVPTVRVDVCFDVTGVDILDADGQSIVSPNRDDTGTIRYSIANYEWDSDPDGAWRVASSQNIEGQPCAAS